MDPTYWCPECADAQVGALRQSMVAGHIGAQEQAKALKGFRATHAGWRAERCGHRRCGPRRMPPAVREAVLKERPEYPRPPPSDEALGYLQVAARNAPLETLPEHVEAAERGDALAEEREAREVAISRRTQAQRRDEAMRRAEERARAVRKRMKGLGFFEAKQPAGPRIDEDDYRDFVAFKVPELAWEDCWRYGRHAIRVAVEFVCERQQGGNRAAAVLRYAERVHRGLVRNWVRKDVYDQLPPEQQADDEPRHDDAFVHMDGQEDDNELTFWDGGPSKRWQEKQQKMAKDFEAAVAARGLKGFAKALAPKED